MNWTSPAEFFHMGGHGLFVWGSYGVCLLVMTLEPLMAAHRRRQALRAAARQSDNAQCLDGEDT